MRRSMWVRLVNGLAEATRAQRVTWEKLSNAEAAPMRRGYRLVTASGSVLLCQEFGTHSVRADLSDEAGEWVAGTSDGTVPELLDLWCLLRYGKPCSHGAEVVAAIIAALSMEDQ